MATTTERHPKRHITLTIPADNVDDFRVGLIADMKIDAEGFAVEHAHMLEARAQRRERRRTDRDGRIDGIRELYDLLYQLPDDDVEVSVFGAAEAFRFALEQAGRELLEQIRTEFQYCPVPVEGVLPQLLERLRWTVDQVETIGELA